MGNEDLVIENEKLKLCVNNLASAANDVIEYNRQYARDKYGDAEKAESMACVVRLREAIKLSDLAL